MPVILKVNQVCLAEAVAPQQRVLSIHGRSGQGEWQHTQEQAIEYIENRLFSYFIIHQELAVRLVVGQAPTGEKFLKAEPDGDIPALLLQLPCLAHNPNLIPPP
jgi:hypothetical protein